ncbi:MAG: ATP synthase F1 subunit epsilon [Rhodospirillaceae bacterium]
MAETLEFELVSPERLLVSEPVDMVTVPGTEGVFGVLPLHAPTLSTLRPGFIEVYRNGAVAERYLVTGGFAEVTGSACTVLVDEAVPGDQATREYAAERLAKAKDDLAKAMDDDARKIAEASVRVAESIAREIAA